MLLPELASDSTFSSVVLTSDSSGGRVFSNRP